jgi:hypothetical protein
MATQRLSRAPLLSPLAVVACVTLARLIVSAFHPVTEDEAYYWTWSLHPAFGYVDHPPMVAWLIWSTTLLPHTAFFVRLPFVVCEAVAALAAGAAAREMSGSARSALVAATLVVFIPNVKLMIGEALPDPPFLMFWALGILFAARAMRGGAPVDFVLLGIAVAGAMLSRAFGWALLAGVGATFLTGPRDQRAPRAFAVSCAVTLALVAPWIAWNATHDWVNVLFTVRDRQGFRSVSATHAFNNMTVRFLIFDAAFIALAYLVTVRRRYPLLAWTALPFPLALGILAFPQTVEVYWLLGPAISLFVGLGIAGRSAQAWWGRAATGVWIAAGVGSFLVVAFAALPESVQAAMLRNPAVGGSAYSPAYAYARVARDVGQRAGARDSAILSDRYEITSQFQLFGVDAAIVDDVPQRRQWHLWNRDRGVPERAMYVSTEPLSSNPALERRLEDVYERSEPGGELDYGFAGKPAFRFYVTWFSQPRAGSAPAELYGP